MSAPKKSKVLPFEHLYLERLPASPYYERSYLHRDTVSHVVCTPEGYLMTASIDGYIKFWRRPPPVVGGGAPTRVEGGPFGNAPLIEFVKTFRAHTGPITALATSPRGELLVSTSVDQTLKVFDVASCDLLSMRKLSFTPEEVLFCGSRDSGSILVSDKETGRLYKYDIVMDHIEVNSKNGGEAGKKDENEHGPGKKDTDADNAKDEHNDNCKDEEDNESAEKDNNEDEDEEKNEKDKDSANDDTGSRDEPKSFLELDHPIRKLGYSPKHSLLIIITTQGDIYAVSLDLDQPSFPPTISKLMGTLESSPLALSVSPDEQLFCTLDVNRSLCIYRLPTGKLVKKYDESLTLYRRLQEEGKLALSDEAFEILYQRETVMAESPYAALNSCIFDESGNFLLISTPVGIKLLNLTTNRVMRIIGKGELRQLRFINLALFQGTSGSLSVSLEMAASDNPALSQAAAREANILLVATALRKPRLYLFSAHTIETPAPDEERNVMNERGISEEQNTKVTVPPPPPKLSSSKWPTVAVVRTNCGDIHITLFPEQAPLAVENFVGLARKGYYDRVIFHRVIRGFMIQTGDPLGDGTGGSSIWNREFRDEINPDLRHDRPGTVSMANAGPNTNGSQFFITTAKCSWLDGKHTIFGRIHRGMDVVHHIEVTPTGKHDRPLREVRIIQISFPNSAQ